jgi:hypothetical protein
LPKVTRQPSGVTAGTMDDSRQTQPSPAAARTAGAGAALASRRHAGARAAKLAAKKAGVKAPAKRKPH